MSAVFVDYDNIYLSLKRKNEDAAKRFAKDAAVWRREIESGRLIAWAHAPSGDGTRRIVMNRCYGNPVARRNAGDSSTDMGSFPFVRHHFLRGGFEIVDCPPLTAQLKTSSDIRIVMDILDTLAHPTRFDEFVILSGEADFTQVLHRLRAHARRTVVFANDYTAAPYTAICDGEIREADLIALLLDGKVPSRAEASAAAAAGDACKDIVAEVAERVRGAAGVSIPLDALAEHVVRVFGPDKTTAANWAGAGSFRELLLHALPSDIRLSEHAPFFAYVESDVAPERSPQSNLPEADPDFEESSAPREPIRPAPTPPRRAEPEAGPAAASVRTPPAEHPAPAVNLASTIQQSIARIHDACQAPPLAPPEYRVIFDVMAREINERGILGLQTLANIEIAAREAGVDVRREDIRFVFEVVSADDRWFEKGASANLFAGRFRNFVVARCRNEGLNLSTDELELIETWFAATGVPALAPPQSGRRGESAPAAQPTARALLAESNREPQSEARPAFRDERAPRTRPADFPEPRASAEHPAHDEFPRIVRARLRG
ncbi:MAG: NYN domain-containing protein [Hyphomicrobiaceae bacterium]